MKLIKRKIKDLLAWDITIATFLLLLLNGSSWDQAERHFARFMRYLDIEIELMNRKRAKQNGSVIVTGPPDWLSDEDKARFKDSKL